MNKISRRDEDMRYRRHLSRLARSGLFPHPERLTPEFERRQRRLLRAFSRALRAGPPPCPHCGKAITAEDLEPRKGSPPKGHGCLAKSG